MSTIAKIEGRWCLLDDDFQVVGSVESCPIFATGEHTREIEWARWARSGALGLASDGKRAIQETEWDRKIQAMVNSAKARYVPGKRGRSRLLCDSWYKACRQMLMNSYKRLERLTPWMVWSETVNGNHARKRLRARLVP